MKNGNAEKARDKLISKSDIMFTILLLLGAVGCFFLSFSGAGGNTAVVRQNGEVIVELPLDQDAVYIVSGAYENVIEIQNGAVFVSRSTCPNEACVKTGTIRSAGQSIVCAPNAMSVEVISDGGAGVDVVTG